MHCYCYLFSFSKLFRCSCLRAVFILTMQPMVLCPYCSASTISKCSTSLISRSWCWIWFAIWAIRWHVNIEFPALDGHPPPREIIRTLKATSIFNTYCTRFIDFFFFNTNIFTVPRSFFSNAIWPISQLCKGVPIMLVWWGPAACAINFFFEKKDYYCLKKNTSEQPPNPSYGQSHGAL